MKKEDASRLEKLAKTQIKNAWEAGQLTPSHLRMFIKTAPDMDGMIKWVEENGYTPNDLEKARETVFIDEEANPKAPPV